MYVPPHKSKPFAPDPTKPLVAIPEVLVDMKQSVIRDLAARLRFSPSEGRIWLDERRMVMLHAEAFSSMREELIASLGTDTARGLLTRIGYAAGCRDADMVWKAVGSQASIHELMRAGAVMHAMQGFVLPENLLERNPNEPFNGDTFYGEWIWKQSIEDEGHIQHHGVGNHAVCWSEVGYSSGYLSTCAGRRILVREIECRAMGHPHCRNIAKPVAQWEDAAEDLRFLEPQPLPPAKVYVPAHLPSAIAPQATATPAAPDDFVGGASTVSHVLRHKLLRVATTHATVLLLGESGVGKSLIAREVHRSSRRSEQPFIEVNCAAIPEQLIESELFGIERGAYSGAVSSRAGRFEAANGGTLFLDEIATLSMTAQGKLLRVLQNGELERLGSNKTLKTDVRVITATNENLQTAVREGRFREDLFFRLNVFPLVIQPLRERREDIPLLTDAILARFARRHGRSLQGITPRAMRAILHHSWPGNIRELENVLERGVILCQDDELIDTHHLFSVDNAHQGSALLGVGHGGSLTPLDDMADACAEPQSGSAALEALADGLLREGRATLGDMEDAMTRAALKQTGGNISKAAALLGVTRAQLDYRVKKIETQAA